MTAAQAANRVMAAVGAALAILALLLTVATLAGRRVLSRQRLAAWEAEWGLVGPRWTHPTW